MADAEWRRVDQHERDASALAAAVDPGVICSALDHHVAGLEVNGRVVHFHVNLARDHDYIIDRLGAVHAAAVTGRKVDHREARPLRGWGGTEDARAAIFDR